MTATTNEADRRRSDRRQVLDPTYPGPERRGADRRHKASKAPPSR